MSRKNKRQREKERIRSRAEGRVREVGDRGLIVERGLFDALGCAGVGGGGPVLVRSCPGWRKWCVVGEIFFLALTFESLLKGFHLICVVLSGDQQIFVRHYTHLCRCVGSSG